MSAMYWIVSIMAATLTMWIGYLLGSYRGYKLGCRDGIFATAEAFSLKTVKVTKSLIDVLNE